MNPRCLLPLFAAVLMLVAAHTADAQNDVEGARKEYQQGNALFKKGDYEAAKVRFKNANLLAPSPILHYNIALCDDRLGNVNDAIAGYRRYLQEVPGAANRAEVEASIGRLVDQSKAAQPLAKDKEPAAEPATTDGAPKDTVTAAEPNPGEKAAAGDAEPAPPTVQYDGDDPMLQRAAAINIADVRDQSEFAVEDDPVTAPVGPVDDSTAESKPFYKNVWFWVVAGVGAVVLVSLAASSGDDTPTTNETRGIGFSF